MRSLHCLLICLIALPAFAAELPTDWRSWPVVDTPLTQQGGLPDCNAVTDMEPAIYREIATTYCSAQPGGPGKVRVLVRPSAMGAYQARQGNFPEGDNMILHLQDMKLLFVTRHTGQQPLYYVYTEDGKDVTGSRPNLNAEVCSSCHNGFNSYCRQGQCGSPQ